MSASDAHTPGAVVKPHAPSVLQRKAQVVADDVLVDRACCGDEEAFAVLYHRYKLDVWNLAYFRLKDRHEAEDTVQETFIKAYRALDRFRRHDRVRPWLLVICRNVCMDRLRARPARALSSLDDAAIAEPAASVHDEDGRIDLHIALTGLPVEDLEAFFLVDVLGCASDEAARIAGVRASSTLRSRVARARRHIAEVLDDSAPRDAVATTQPIRTA